MSVSLLMGWGLLVLLVLLVVALVAVLVLTRGPGSQQDGMSSPAQGLSANVFERGAPATAAAPAYWPVLPAGSGSGGLPASLQGSQGAQAVVAGVRTVGQPGLTRSPIAVWLLLPVVTLGIYSYVWYYKINRELRDFHPAIQVDPTLALLAMFVPFVGLVSLYNTGKRIGAAQQLSGLDKPCSGGLGVLACFAFGLHAVYYQSQLNRLWAQQGA